MTKDITDQDERKAILAAMEEIQLAERFGWLYCKLLPDHLRALLNLATRPHD